MILSMINFGTSSSIRHQFLKFSAHIGTAGLFFSPNYFFDVRGLDMLIIDPLHSFQPFSQKRNYSRKILLCILDTSLNTIEDLYFFPRIFSV